MGMHMCHLCEESRAEPDEFGFSSSGDIRLRLRLAGEEVQIELPDMFFHYLWRSHCLDLEKHDPIIYKALRYGVFLDGHRLQSKGPYIPVAYLRPGEEFITRDVPDIELLRRVAEMVLTFVTEEWEITNVFGKNGLAALGFIGKS